MAFVLVRFSNNRKKKRSGIGYVEFMLPVEKKKSPCWTFIPVSSPEFFLKNKRKKERDTLFISKDGLQMYINLNNTQENVSSQVSLLLESGIKNICRYAECFVHLLPFLLERQTYISYCAK